MTPVSDLIAELLRISLVGQPRTDLADGLFSAPPAPAAPSGIRPGAQVQDDSLGENAHLGWGTAPEMQYPQTPAVPPANFAAAAHQRPPIVRNYPPPRLRHGTQHVAIEGPYGTHPLPPALLGALHRLRLPF